MTKIALSFDDGRKDNYRLAQEMLIPMQIPATFNITTDYVMGRKGYLSPCPNLAMNREEVVDLAGNRLFEIAGHGKAHHNGFDNLINGVRELREWCHLDQIGIASPNSKLTDAEIRKKEERYRKEGITYIRIGDRAFGGKFARKCIRKLNTRIHSDDISSWVYKDTLLSEKDDFILNSVPVLRCDSLSGIKRLVGDAVRKDKSCVMMFHSVLKEGEEFYEDLWSWDFKRFRLLCSWLKEMESEKKLQVCKTLDLVSSVDQSGKRE